MYLVMRSDSVCTFVHNGLEIKGENLEAHHRLVGSRYSKVEEGCSSQLGT